MKVGQRPARRSSSAAGLAALGIVFGDLGTSPLYTYQTVVQDAGSAHGAGLGSLSLIIWSLLIVVSLKYATVVMRADNAGEGGILALLALVGARFGRTAFLRATLLTLAGLFGAALLYGDGVITPAISVLSALEGVNVATPVLKPYVLPAAIIVLIGLFALQPLGTQKIGSVFGPVMLVWFIVIGAIGLYDVVQHPAVIAAVNPLVGLGFLTHHGFASLVMLGGVFLALTGAEALYADMSHVGRRPIRLTWTFVVLPALLLSYAGQAATDGGGGKGNPFFLAAPHWSVIPLVVIATAATIIASQSIITGVFTLTRQAMQLGWFPGLSIRQTSDREYGQIYVPAVNWIMMVATVAIALSFRTSDNLSSAYGTAVSATMLMTTALIYDVMRHRWGWSIAQAAPVAAFFLVVDLVFFAANLLKIVDGGYVPLAIGVAILIVMTTWHRGVGLVRAGLAPFGDRADEVMAGLRSGAIARTPGTFVFLARRATTVPPLMARYVTQFRALPERCVVLSIEFTDTPRVAEAERVTLRDLGEQVWLVAVRFGFVEIPNLATALRLATEKGCPSGLDDAYFVAGNDDVVRHPEHRRIAGWRRILFAFLYRNAVRASDRFALPRDRLIEIGHQVGM